MLPLNLIQVKLCAMKLKKVFFLGLIVLFLVLFAFNASFGSTSSNVIPSENPGITNGDRNAIKQSNLDGERTPSAPIYPDNSQQASTEKETAAKEYNPTKMSPDITNGDSSAIKQSNLDGERTPSAPIHPDNSQQASTEKETAANEYCNSTELFVKENERRLAWIETQCRNLPTLQRHSVMYEIFYFGKSNLGYCPVYKAASSNVFAHFCSDYHAERICQDKTKNGATLYRNSKTFKEPVPSGDEKRFVVVRDPLRRLLSAYRDKMEQLRETFFRNPARDMMLHHRPIRWNINFYRDKSAQQAIDYAEAMTDNKVQNNIPDENNPYLYPPYPTFKEFVSEIIVGWGNPHIVPASQYCGPCGSTKKFDFIVKVETFDCDMRYMLNLIGNVKSAATVEERWATNKGPPGNTSLLYSYYSTLTSEQLEALLEYYQDDCLLYQYPCQELVDNIRTFKLLNPNHKYEYKNTWSGRTVS